MSFARAGRRACAANGPGRSPVRCRRRGARVAAVATGRLNVEVFLFIRQDTGCGLAEAKGMVTHLVKESGECHWCGAAIPVAELVDCPECGALNIAP